MLEEDMRQMTVAAEEHRAKMEASPEAAEKEAAIIRKAGKEAEERTQAWLEQQKKAAEEEQQKEGEEQQKEAASGSGARAKKEFEVAKKAFGANFRGHPPCRAIVEFSGGRFVVSSALATTQGIARLLELRAQKLRSRGATNLYEHLSKEDSKEIKARMKDEWLARPENNAMYEDLYASLMHHVQTLALTQGPITFLELTLALAQGPSNCLKNPHRAPALVFSIFVFSQEIWERARKQAEIRKEHDEQQARGNQFGGGVWQS